MKKVVEAKKVHPAFDASHLLRSINPKGKGLPYRCQCGLRTYGADPKDWEHDSELQSKCVFAAKPAEPTLPTQGDAK